MSYLISVLVLANVTAGCSVLAIAGEEVADEVIEKEVVPFVEEELKEKIEK